MATVYGLIRYSSKKDIWIVCVLVISCIVIVADIIFNFGGGERKIVLGLTVLFVIMSCLFIRYDINGKKLIIKIGILRYSIDITTIENIETCGSWIASPALSLDRIRIDYVNKRKKRKSVIISPSHRKVFINELIVRGAKIK